MKPFVHPEMMVHIPLCTHKEPKNVLVASDSAEALMSEIGRYLGIDTVVINATNVLESLRNVADKSIDVALFDLTDGDAALMAHLNRVLTDKGVCVMKHPDLDDVAANTALMQVLGNYFKIIMPYYAGNETLLLCSKEYHPTADVILQRTDLLEGQQFYNCDVHIGVFAMPQYVRKNYLGIIRN